MPRTAARTVFSGTRESALALKTYVIDTSVLLSDPHALRNFAEHSVVVPVVVITELEAKRHHPELGYFARTALRYLDDLRLRYGRLDAPVPVNEAEGTLQVELNHTDPEVLPPGFRLGDNDSRILAVAHAVLRRKHDGRYLAAVSTRGVHPLVPGLPREPGLDEAWDALENFERATRGFDADAQGLLPLHALQDRLHAVGLDEDAYANRTGLALVAEPAALAFAGRDRYRRPLWLTRDAARAWLAVELGNPG